VPEHPSRVTALDALRGAGVLGILPVHMQSFASIFAMRWGDSSSPEGRE